MTEIPGSGSTADLAAQPKVPIEVLPHLTSWRFFAAALVVFHHFLFQKDRLAADRSIFNPSYALFDAGFVAVSFFFVLSGFILCYTTLARTEASKLDKRQYFLNRFARIYPLYALSLLPEAMAALRGAYQSGGAGNALGFFVAKMTMVQGWIPRYIQGWNDPTWSLSVEALFYLLFPFLILPIAKIPRKSVVSALAIALVLGVAVQIWLRNDYPCPDEMRFFARHPMVRVPEFLIGMLLGRVYLEGLANKEFWRKSTIWFAALAIVAMCVYRAVGIPANALALLPLVGMVFGAAYGKGGIMSNPTLVLLGEASYGLYLLHAPVHMILERLAAKVDFDLTTPVGFLLILVSSVVASVFVHKSFEVPMRNYIRKRFGGGKPVKVGEGR